MLLDDLRDDEGKIRGKNASYILLVYESGERGKRYVIVSTWYLRGRDSIPKERDSARPPNTGNPSEMNRR